MSTKAAVLQRKLSALRERYNQRSFREIVRQTQGKNELARHPLAKAMRAASLSMLNADDASAAAAAEIVTSNNTDPEVLAYTRIALDQLGDSRSILDMYKHAVDHCRPEHLVGHLTHLFHAHGRCGDLKQQQLVATRLLKETKQQNFTLWGAACANLLLTDKQLRGDVSVLGADNAPGAKAITSDAGARLAELLLQRGIDKGLRSKEALLLYLHTLRRRGRLSQALAVLDGDQARGRLRMSRNPKTGAKTQKIVPLDMPPEPEFVAQQARRAEAAAAKLAAAAAEGEGAPAAAAAAAAAGAGGDDSAGAEEVELEFFDVEVRLLTWQDEVRERVELLCGLGRWEEAHFLLRRLLLDHDADDWATLLAVVETGVHCVAQDHAGAPAALEGEEAPAADGALLPGLQAMRTAVTLPAEAAATDKDMEDRLAAIKPAAFLREPVLGQAPTELVLRKQLEAGQKKAKKEAEAAAGEEAKDGDDDDDEKEAPATAAAAAAGGDEEPAAEAPAAEPADEEAEALARERPSVTTIRGFLRALQRHAFYSLGTNKPKRGAMLAELTLECRLLDATDGAAGSGALVTPPPDLVADLTARGVISAKEAEPREGETAEDAEKRVKNLRERRAEFAQAVGRDRALAMAEQVAAAADRLGPVTGYASMLLQYLTLYGDRMVVLADLSHFLEPFARRPLTATGHDWSALAASLGSGKQELPAELYGPNSVVAGSFPLLATTFSQRLAMGDHVKCSPLSLFYSPQRINGNRGVSPYRRGGYQPSFPVPQAAPQAVEALIRGIRQAAIPSMEQGASIVGIVHRISTHKMRASRRKAAERQAAGKAAAAGEDPAAAAAAAAAAEDAKKEAVDEAEKLAAEAQVSPEEREQFRVFTTRVVRYQSAVRLERCMGCHSSSDAWLDDGCTGPSLADAATPAGAIAGLTPAEQGELAAELVRAWRAATALRFSVDVHSDALLSAAACTLMDAALALMRRARKLAGGAAADAQSPQEVLAAHPESGVTFEGDAAALEARARHLLLEAALLLEHGVALAPKSFPLRLTATRCYAMLSAVKRLEVHFTELHARNVQLDTLLHLFLPHAYRMGGYSEAQNFGQALTAQTLLDWKQARPNHTEQAFSRGSVHKVPEVARMDKRLTNSLQLHEARSILGHICIPSAKAEAHDWLRRLVTQAVPEMFVDEPIDTLRGVAHPNMDFSVLQPAIGAIPSFADAQAADAARRERMLQWIELRRRTTEFLFWALEDSPAQPLSERIAPIRATLAKLGLTGEADAGVVPDEAGLARDSMHTHGLSRERPPVVRALYQLLIDGMELAARGQQAKAAQVPVGDESEAAVAAWAPVAEAAERLAATASDVVQPLLLSGLGMPTAATADLEGNVASQTAAAGAAGDDGAASHPAAIHPSFVSECSTLVGILLPYLPLLLGLAVDAASAASPKPKKAKKPKKGKKTGAAKPAASAGAGPAAAAKPSKPAVAALTAARGAGAAVLALCTAVDSALVARNQAISHLQAGGKPALKYAETDLGVDLELRDEAAAAFDPAQTVALKELILSKEEEEDMMAQAAAAAEKAKTDADSPVLSLSMFERIFASTTRKRLGVLSDILGSQASALYRLHLTLKERMDALRQTQA